MQLYAGSSAEFLDEAVQRKIAQRISDAFYNYYRFRASVGELNSWQYSLTALAMQCRYSGILDHGIVIEMQLPLSSSRLDCMIFGKSMDEQAGAVLIELKQWTEAQASSFEKCVESFVGGRVRAVLHPSVQALGYADYLRDMHSAFSEDSDGILIQPIAWLHNMHPGAATVLRSQPFDEFLKRAPLFVSSDVDTLTNLFKKYVGRGGGMAVMERALRGKHRPSKKLLDHTSKLVAGEPIYRLIDDQIVAYEAVLSLVRRAIKDKRQKAVVVIKGGPGTGKSVIALNLLGTLSQYGAYVQHATGSKAFTENLWRVLGSRSKAQIKYFNSYGQAEQNSIDVLLADEAHRIRSTSNSRFTPIAKKSDKAQIEEMLSAAKVCAFFIDDHQAVRPGEVGSTALIRESAMKIGARYEEINLRAQFRCGGSDAYIEWLDQLLEIRKTGTITLERDRFDFRVVDSPIMLDHYVKEYLAQKYTARIMAGYCWRWSEAREDGTLINDVHLPGFERPWNAKPEAKRLAPGIPKAMFWASDPGGVGQVGCVYTAQGFEFDFAGVIWGLDLVIRDGKWVGQPKNSYDHVVKTRAGSSFLDCVKNTYRVLLTRGLQGCAVYIEDEETRKYVVSRTEVPFKV